MTESTGQEKQLREDMHQLLITQDMYLAYMKHNESLGFQHIMLV
jgi:hypothetical protein